ncbi:MAG: co-chaperone DjlA [Gammaproteobacteria bacterium]|nr:MAG: co-chaperone DjlA [Gammaproteobacteria bacterium]
MSWWGKLIGGYVGFALGGPIGALLGVALGHGFDKDGSTRTSAPFIGQQNRSQAAFFTATFSVMGHICKADGRVTPDEISAARMVMSQMSLSPEQKDAAIALFNEGKKDGFPLEDVLSQLKSELGLSKNIKRVFIEIQCSAAYADGVLHPAEKKLLEKICRLIGFSEYELNSILAAISAEAHHQKSGHGGRSGKMQLDDAHAILNVDPDASDSEVKRAYRKLISQHHPDKLISKGLPEEMMKIATQKTQEIRAAYECVMDERKSYLPLPGLYVCLTSRSMASTPGTRCLERFLLEAPPLMASEN